MLHKLFRKLLVFTVLTYNISSDVYSKNTNDNIDNNKLSKNNKTIKINNKSNKHGNNGEINNNNKNNSKDSNKNQKSNENNSNNAEENEDDNDLENDEGNEEDNDTEGDDAEGVDTEEDNTDDEDMKDSDNEDNDTEGDDTEDSDNEDDDIESDDDDENEEDNSVDDPFEKFNRKVFEFNDTMNKLLDKVVDNKNKDKSKSSPIFKGIGNFSNNFFEPPRIINYTLQGNVKNASNSIARLMINTIFGFFGVTDVAEKLGFEKKNTYFGDTLKKWGMKPGPYLVLPILGPTSLRGTFGYAFGLSISSISKLPLKNMKPFARNATYYGIYCCDLLSKRSAYGGMIEQVSAMSKDKYKTFRSLIMSSESN